MDINDATPFAVINGRALQIMTWNGPNIPEGYVPLDGRTIEGVTLPDRRDKWISGGEPGQPFPKYIVLQEIVRIHDLVVDGVLRIPGLFPDMGGV